MLLALRSLYCTRIIEVSWVLRHAAEHSPKTSKQSNVVTCGAHAASGFTDAAKRTCPGALCAPHGRHPRTACLLLCSAQCAKYMWSVCVCVFVRREKQYYESRMCPGPPLLCLWRHHAEAGMQSCRPGCLPIWCLLGSHLGASPGSEPVGLGGYVASVPARPLRATSCIRRHGRLPVCVFVSVPPAHRAHCVLQVSQAVCYAAEHVTGLF